MLVPRCPWPGSQQETLVFACMHRLHLLLLLLQQLLLLIREGGNTSRWLPLRQSMFALLRSHAACKIAKFSTLALSRRPVRHVVLSTLYRASKIARTHEMIQNTFHSLSFSLSLVLFPRAPRNAIQRYY